MGVRELVPQPGKQGALGGEHRRVRMPSVRICRERGEARVHEGEPECGAALVEAQRHVPWSEARQTAFDQERPRDRSEDAPEIVSEKQGARDRAVLRPVRSPDAPKQSVEQIPV